MQKNMHKYAKNIAKKYANNMQNIHESVYWHILHICVLLTLLMKF